MNIGIIGAGSIGSILARKLSALGHSVRIANSRGPQTLATLALETGATAVSVADAVSGVDMVIVSIPQKAVALLPDGLFKGASNDLIVVDTGNYYPRWRDEPVDAIERGLPESAWVAQKIQHPVVKAFNSITAQSLAIKGRPPGSIGRIALPVSGDDARAKAVVIGLMDAIGFDGFDAGDLAHSWRQQPGTPAYCTDFDLDAAKAALLKADKARAPELRDAFMTKLMQLPPGSTPADRIELGRSMI